MTKSTENLKKIADDLLVDIAEADAILSDIKARKTEALEAAAQPYIAQETKWTEEKQALEDELQALMQQNKSLLWPLADDEEVADLPSGRLRRGIIRRARRVKKMVEKLKAAGRTDLIRIEEKANWDAIDQQDDEALDAIGTQRTIKEAFDYECKK